jgi:hypothetical protein
MSQELSLKSRVPILDPTKRQENHYVRRIVLAASLGASALVGAFHVGDNLTHHAISSYEQTAKPTHELTAAQLRELPKVEIVTPGSTVWSIASAEGPKVADDPAALFNAELIIEDQLPKQNPNNLQAGMAIHLPASSEIGTFTKKQ